MANTNETKKERFGYSPRFMIGFALFVAIVAGSLYFIFWTNIGRAMTYAALNPTTVNHMADMESQNTKSFWNQIAYPKSE